jgi:hypothetical protein
MSCSGAARAVRPASAAHAGAQVHQALGVGGHGAVRVAAWAAGLRPAPTARALVRCRQVVVEAQHARQHALARCRRGWRTRSPKQKAAIAAAVERRCPAAWPGTASCAESSRRGGHHLLRAAVQVARAAVVAQAAPQGQHLVLAGLRPAVCTSGKRARKARVVASTVLTCVCCSMISDSHTRYGSRVPCQGRSWRPCTALPGHDARRQSSAGAGAASHAGVDGSATTVRCAWVALRATRPGQVVVSSPAWRSSSACSCGCFLGLDFAYAVVQATRGLLDAIDRLDAAAKLRRRSRSWASSWPPPSCSTAPPRSPSAVS